MGPISLLCRKSYSVELVLEQLLEVARDLIVRDEQPVVIRHRDQLAVEQPVDGPGERNPVLDDIGTALGDRPNMSRLHL